MTIPATVLELPAGVQQLFSVPQQINATLEKYSPSTIIVMTAISLLAVSTLKNSLKRKWGESSREMVGRIALKVPFIANKYSEDINKQLTHFQESVRKKWEVFGPLYTEIPEQGIDCIKLLDKIKGYSEIISRALHNKHLSGTIYSKNLVQDCESAVMVPSEKWNEDDNLDDGAYLHALSKKLQKLYTYAFEQSYLWNSLHSNEFSIGTLLDYQVVRMVADMFGGNPREVMGFVTSGGSESLMVAVRSYREWGIKNRGHAPGEGVIIAGKSVHASIIKGGLASLVNVELVDTDETGKMDVDQLKALTQKHGNKVLAIIGSAPSYPTGVMDPIAEMAKIAKDNGCGLHVDCCLGAFVVNNLEQHNTSFLQIPGVTSLSADTHKNGLAPKGSSVLVTKKIGTQNLAYYSIYSIPEWSGGVYGTPKDAGSQSCVPSLCAFLALLGTGKEGYRRIAQAIHLSACALALTVNEFPGQLRLIAKPEANVVAFKIDEAWGLQKGATYAFADEMSKRNFVLNAISNDIVHFCVTARFAGNRRLLDQFKRAVFESLAATKKLNDKLQLQGKKFSGEAGMYCALGAAIAPNRKQMSLQKYLENMLLGLHGAQDAVKAYFLAQLDPFS